MRFRCVAKSFRPDALAAAAAIGLTLLALTVAAPSRAGAADDGVDLQLVLAADVSRSIDNEKFALQRDGYASAMVDPRVLEAIRSGGHSRIAVSMVEWSGNESQKVVVDWTIVSDVDSGRAVSEKILRAPRAFADRTSISSGIDFAMERFASAPGKVSRRVIDISGDGTNNAGRDVTKARDEALATGVTINGLVILSEDNNMPWNPTHTHPPGGLEKYYKDHVVGGPGAFVIVAKDFNSFGQAIVNKLVAEIALGRPDPARLAMNSFMNSFINRSANPALRRAAR
ncbi:MAG TPA: DUF1194 domain-containing protein [Xanthobacteraceae bacterium]|jgi:hypothetical protein|nr:DUF1194 domain-containing protein [Xanthobacteraceae bacterium]